MDATCCSADIVFPQEPGLNSFLSTLSTNPPIFTGCGRLPGTLQMLPGEGDGRQDLPKPGIHRLAQGLRHSARRTCSGPSPREPVTKTARRQVYQDICDHNMIEVEFGTGKRAYGLNRIMADLRETSFCVIGVAFYRDPLSSRRCAARWTRR